MTAMDTRLNSADATTGASGARHGGYTVEFPALDRRIDCRPDETLFAAARRAGLRIVGACGGRGTCGTCIVRVTEGRVQRDEDTTRHRWQRACGLQPRSDLVVDVAPRSLAPIVRADVHTGGDDAALPLDPAVRSRALRVDPSSMQDLACDTDRVRRALAAVGDEAATAVIECSAAAELPMLLRSNDWQVQAHLASTPHGPRLIGFAAPGAPLLGLAVDLGTTNAAAFMVDLTTGRRVASLGLENPQLAWGADLISRVDHAIKDAATAEHLRQAAVNAINALAHDLAREAGATARDIVDLVVCGNTAMQHLLAGWPVAQLGRAPFVAATHDAVDVAARSLGLQVATGAQLHLAPSIGGFVGGDHVAALLATEPLWSAPGTSLVMDIGTNTEISLIHDGRIWSSSCPSGPALEGGNVGCGMRAAEGAIERVRIDAGIRLVLQVIGEATPVGLCGSGVLDALAAFVDAGWIDQRGRIVGQVPAIGVVDGLRGITLVEATADIPAVRFTQHDVRAVQLAKSAIRTGVQLMCVEAGMDESRIDRFIIAGAFGAYIGIESCVAIGLLPDLPRERFTQVGNAAGLGVQQMLAARQRRARAARLAATCRYVELSARSDFQKIFLHHIGFPPRKTS